MRREKNTTERYYSLITNPNTPSLKTKTLVSLLNGTAAQFVFRKEPHRMIGRMPPMPTKEDLA